MCPTSAGVGRPGLPPALIFFPISLILWSNALRLDCGKWRGVGGREVRALISHLQARVQIHFSTERWDSSHCWRPFSGNSLDVNKEFSSFSCFTLNFPLQRPVCQCLHCGFFLPVVLVLTMY